MSTYKHQNTHDHTVTHTHIPLRYIHTHIHTSRHTQTYLRGDGVNRKSVWTRYNKFHITLSQIFIFLFPHNHLKMLKCSTTTILFFLLLSHPHHKHPPCVAKTIDISSHLKCNWQYKRWGVKQASHITLQHTYFSYHTHQI